ncbi:MAG: hypothetical protein IPO07_24110 [Haliscomenobacter sp.]|nr:hypothetical protein [Haliscomenobacter sp.]MBK9491531.1 hypothetical protein [Haliscomenobacter sp.]
MEDYEQYLSDNAEDDERRAAAQVMEGLAGLRLESKLREVAAEQAAQHRRTFWRRLLFTLAALAFLAAVAYWFFSKNEATPSVPPSEKQAPSAPAPRKEQTPDQNKSEKPREKPLLPKSSRRKKFQCHLILFSPPLRYRMNSFLSRSMLRPTWLPRAVRAKRILP